MLLNELGIGSLAEFHARVPQDRAHRPYDFSFTRAFPGDVVTLHIQDAVDWKTLPTLHRPLFSGDGAMMYGFDGRQREPAQAPAAWPPYRHVIVRNLPET